MSMSRKRQNEINEKLTYSTRCTKWKRLKRYGDISAICGITLLSRTIVSHAVNTGTGNLPLLRAIDRYFDERAEVADEQEYFDSPRGKKKNT